MAGGTARARGLGKGRCCRTADLRGGKLRTGRGGRAADAGRSTVAHYQRRGRRRFVMTALSRISPAKISAVVSDVDGTLMTDEKRLTPRAQAAVAELHARGIIFTIISSRPL